MNRLLSVRLSRSLSSRTRAILGPACLTALWALLIAGTVRFLHAENRRQEIPEHPAVTVPTLERALIERYAGRVRPPAPLPTPTSVPPLPSRPFPPSTPLLVVPEED